MIRMLVTASSEQGFFHRLWFGARNVDRRDDLMGIGASSHADHIDFLFMGIFWISLVSFIIVVGLMLWFAWKYRARPGVKTVRSPSHHTLLELTWCIVPLIAMTWMFFEGFKGFIDAHVAEAGAEEITVIAQKWEWIFEYSNGARSVETTEEAIGARKLPVFVAPVNRPVLLRMKSLDVIHSFWVPDFRTKQDVFPNRWTSYWFKAEKTGRHLIFCAEYCGDSHSEMAAILEIVEPEEYVRRVRAWNSPAEGALPWQIGQWVARRKGCFGCHTDEPGKVGSAPSWVNSYGYPVEFTDGTSLAARDENYIRESIYEPARKIVKGYGNNMTLIPMTEEEVGYIIEYMKHLSDRGPRSLLNEGNGGAN